MAELIQRPNLGFALGLRKQHYQQIVADRSVVDWFEAITENYLIPGGKPRHYLDRIRADHPLIMHGVSLSIGGKDPLNPEYLRQVKGLAQQIELAWISDHQCWTGIEGINLHDLLPSPYTEEAIRHVVDRLGRVQDFFGRRILIENVSGYVGYVHSQDSHRKRVRLCRLCTLGNGGVGVSECCRTARGLPDPSGHRQ